MELSAATILIGLVPILGIGAGYFFLGPIKNMFKGFGKVKKHNTALAEGETKIKVLSSKSSEVVVKVKNIEKAAEDTKKKIKAEVVASQARVDKIINSDAALTELATEFDKEW
jgi:nitrogen regulatory protein PII